ncbi:MAG: HAMP domain-containing sensor histidine kinase [Pirellulales bacterium]
MFERRSIRWPVALGVTMIVLLVALTIGWILLAVFGAIKDQVLAPVYWTILTVGSMLFALLLTGVVLYLILVVKEIKLSQRQSNFMDSVTHELKSPLASLKLYLQTLTRYQVDQAQAADFHRFMLDDVERLDQLINQLLDAARMERQASPREVEDVELSGLLRECAESVCLRYRVDEDAIRLNLAPCIVRARRVDVDMIFRNLLDNAVKYANDDSPEVEVTCQSLPMERVEVRISDNGRGIPPTARRKIFGRFVRLGSELERDKPGTGLGLYIVGTLVRRLKGKIKVRDRVPSPGTVFEVQLAGTPASAAASQSLDAGPSSP